MSSCRVICATNCDLQEMIRAGRFREDLYWRVSGKKVNLRPLRERRDDIPDLVDFFLSNDRPKRNKKFSDDGIEALKVYHWPGNVRELKRVCEQLSLTSPLPVIRGRDVQGLLSYTAPQSLAADFDFSQGLNELVGQHEAHILKKALQKFQGDIDHAAELLKISRSSFYKKVKDYNIEIK